MNKRAEEKRLTKRRGRKKREGRRSGTTTSISVVMKTPIATVLKKNSMKNCRGLIVVLHQLRINTMITSKGRLIRLSEQRELYIHLKEG